MHHKENLHVENVFNYVENNNFIVHIFYTNTYKLA